MAAIVRLKRRISDEPPETILVSCNKKKKSDDGIEFVSEKSVENVTSQVLKFAATVTDKNEEISKHIRTAIKKEKLEKEYKRHIGTDVSSQNRSLKKISSSKNRYNIVSQFRAKQLDKIDEMADEEAEADKKEVTTGEEAGSSSKNPKVFCLYDIEQENMTSNQVAEEEVVTCNSVPMIKEKVASPNGDIDKNYVYDLYYINQPHFNYSWLENITCVDVYKQDSIYIPGQYSDDEVYEDDDDDSNDENNWRNDYPDEDPHFYDPVEVSDDDDYLTESKAGNSDEDDMLAAQLERCYLDMDEKKEKHDDNDDDDDDEHYNYLEYNQFPYYHKEPSYESYMERVLKELSDA